MGMDQDQLETCESKTHTDGRAMSQKASCTSGFVVLYTYLGSTCAGTAGSTLNFKCMSDQ